MNIALTKIYAAASANFCGRYSFARGVGLGCALALAGVSAAQAGPVEKEQREAQREARQAQAQAQAPVREPRVQAAPAAAQPQREPVRNEARQFDPRAFEARAEEQRRLLQMQQDQGAHNADASRRTGRLTPDERRDLRRQINEAGIELYPNTPRR